MRNRRPRAAFTLIELLTVIAIIGLMAAMVAPVVSHFRKGDSMLAGSRQMLDAVARARQLAISQRTTVYMVFVSTNFWGPNPAIFVSPLTLSEREAATNLVDKQLTGYTFVSLRSIGDQPGRNTARYLSDWQSLAEGVFIPAWKFDSYSTPRRIINSISGRFFDVYAFDHTNNIPFPAEESYYRRTVYPLVPFIAFDYQGRLLSGRDEYIPLAHGGVAYSLTQTKTPMISVDATLEREAPPGNSTNSSYNLIHIDWLTGRARLERQEVQ